VTNSIHPQAHIECQSVLQELGTNMTLWHRTSKASCLAC